nr:3621_t:CDS:2 [Entrophospora candida]
MNLELGLTVLESGKLNLIEILKGINTYWKKPIDNYAQIVVSNKLREFGDFQSYMVLAFVEEVVVNAGVLLTAMEEHWKDDLANRALINDMALDYVDDNVIVDRSINEENIFLTLILLSIIYSY